MNPHFNSERRHEGEVPARVYARLDSVEQIEEQHLVIGIDTVSADSADRFMDRALSADWTLGDLIAPQRPDRIREPPKPDWLGMYHDLALGQLEILLTREEALLTFGTDELSKQSSHWLEIELGPGPGLVGTREGLFYPNLFTEALTTPVRRISAAQPSLAASLQQAFSMQDWPQHSPNQLKPYLQEAQAHIWAIYDIGQGSANGLLSEHGPVTLMHDIGCGVYRNAKTRPTGLMLCHSDPAPIILSHWDTDHWAGARAFAPTWHREVFLQRTWIAPYDSTVGPRHIAFAASILEAGGTLVILEPGVWKSNPIALADGRSLALIQGSGHDRNGRGIALEVTDRDPRRRWLMTGDVDYEYLAPHLASNYVGLAVPHHGARPMGAKPPRPSAPYARLAYSFGPDNSFAHPRTESLTAHAAQGWNLGAWTSAHDVANVAGGEVLATARHTPSSTHLRAAVIGWQGPPPTHPLPPCGTTCSAALHQS